MTKRKPTAEQVKKMRPPGGWGGVKFVITERAMRDPAERDQMGDPYCCLRPPGLFNATAGDIFSLSDEEAEALRPELWLRSGLVDIYREPPKTKPKADADEGN